MKSGATYLPIDASYPADRTRFILEDSGTTLVVTGEGFDTSIQGSFDTIPIDLSPVTDGAGPVAPAADAAYVVYTSGSTGQPKGAVVPHAGLTNLVEWHIRTFGLAPKDRTTQFASPGFDAAAWETWPTLAAGASLFVVGDALRNDPPAFRDFLVDRKISVAFAPTVMAEQLMGCSWPAGTALRSLLTGGGALSRFPPPGLPFDVVNNFGLSEATVVSTSGIVAPRAHGAAPTIGREIDGVVVHILGDRLEPVDVGTAGELYIGGVSVALGYLNRPELTSERFVPDPSGAPGCLYRSGDLVRRRADGEIEFLGRLDDQMSVRGFRVEPAEIAGALLRRGDVGSVYISGDADCNRCGLTAHLVAAGTAQPTDAELRAGLAPILPDHMVPSRFVWIDELPLGPHGKVDRRALHAACALEIAGDASAQWSGTEATVGSMVRELLGRDDVAVDADFFLLGGHSMLAAELLMRIEAVCGVQLPLLTLFDGPSIGEIASAVDRQAAALPAG